MLRKLLSHDNFHVKLRAINALEVIGEKARPVLPELRKYASGKGRDYLKRSAEHIVQTLK